MRVLIGEACRALGDDEAARLEHKAARSEFERLGAQRRNWFVWTLRTCLARPPQDIP